MLNLWVASCQGTRMVILSGTARPWNIIFIWTHTYLPRFCVPRYFISSLRCIAFRICKACYRENSFCPKTTPKNGLSEFGRSWRPNRSQQVNFWGTPEKNMCIKGSGDTFSTVFFLPEVGIPGEGGKTRFASKIKVV